MNSKIISKGILAAVAVSVLLSGMVLGCKQATGSDSPTVETIKWVKTSDNYYQFKTNDSKYFSSFVALTFDTKPLTTDTLTIKCKKLSGYENCGAGIVFFRGENWDNFYTAVVTPTGYYSVWKMVGGKWVDTPVIDWPDTVPSCVNTGLGAENTISVSPNVGSTTTYSLSINGTVVASFDRTDSACPADGYYGFYGDISSSTKESFPDIPVDLRFVRVVQ